jgi:predicted PurR-regulated permease PerM
LAINDAVVSLETSLVSSLREMLSGLLLGYSWLITLIFAPILSYYLLKDTETIKRRFVALLPSAWRADVIGLLQEIDGVLIGFVKGNLLIALIVGTMATIALSLLGVDYALTLGVVVGISDLIPYLGPLVGGIPAVAVAMLESNRLAVYVGLTILAIHQIEGGLIAPRILSDRVGLNPFLVVFALLAGGKLWGPLGMVLGVPVAASLRVAIVYVYNRWLGSYPR